MNFGDALIEMRNGHKLARSAWNNRRMYVVYQKGYPNGIPINVNTAAATGIS